MNVLVVDDEPVIRQGLRTLVEWELHGFRLAGEAGDGEEALAYMAEHPVDLVVTDLLMPRMDGLELIRRIREAQTSVGILVLSCLDDFACVKEAMKLGAADYLLKPTMEPEQLLEVLGHMRTELLRSRQEQERLLRWQRENEETKLMRLSRRTGAFLAGGAAEPELERELFADGGQLAVVVVKIFPGNETASSAVETAAVETGCVAVIRLREQQLALYGLQRSASRQEQHARRAACAEALAKRLRAALEDGCRAVVSAGPAAAGLTELKLLAGWHEQRLHRHFYAGELRPGAGAAGPRTPGPVTMLAEEAGPPPAPVAGAAAVAPLPYEARNDLLRALAGGNAAGVRHQLERVAAHVLAARPPAGELLAFAAELVVMAEDAVRQHTSTPGAAADYSRRRAELVASASAAPHAQALFAWLGQAVEELLCLLTVGSGGGQASANPFVRMARQYMQENYSRNLSTAEIAEHVKLNRSYLSELYSRETGETLSEALARIRMEAAKEMLKEGRMKVYEVAEAAGYSDSKIFTKAFKRMTGLTPKKFQ
jgi:two-component system, response regulator YesN